MIAHHDDELTNAFSTLTSYFKRVEGKRGQNALDQYGTRIYLGYSTVSAQYNFCETAASIGRDAIFQPRGTLYQLAQKRIGELRNALVPHGEQAFGNPAYNFRANLPSLDDKRSEEHTSELQSLMRISYAVFCLNKKKNHKK